MLFREERFGMFVHFGLYAQNAWHEQEMWRLGVPKEEYVKLAETFCPREGAAEEWAKAARAAGMQYLCFTVKHHDGFCLWDTKYTDYNIMHSPYGKDLLREVAEACEKYGLLLELYYSQPDWNYPHAINCGGDHQLPSPNAGDEPDEEKYKEYIRNQMKELLTNYGKISAIFWDIPPVGRDPSINAYVRSLMPGILINNRGYDEGDYSTPERAVPEGAFPRLTEACQSVGAESWGYREREDYFTPGHLADSIDRVLTKGGNYLLNVGPDRNGALSPEAKHALREVGNFYSYAKESYEGCRTLVGAPYPATEKEGAIYLHLPAGFPKSGLALHGISELPLSVSLLGSNAEIGAECVKMPSGFWMGKEISPCLHLYGIPAEECNRFPMILKLEFARHGEAVAALEKRTEEHKTVL